MQEITVDQLLHLAKRHARSVSSSVFFISASFVLMLAYGSAWASGTTVDGPTFGVAFFVGLFFGSIAHLVIYFSEGLVATRSIWAGFEEAEPEPEPAPVPTRQRPPVPPRAPNRERPSYATVAPVTTMMHQLEQQVKENASWFNKVDWTGVCSLAKRGRFSESDFFHYMPAEVLEGTEQEPGFTELMEDLRFLTRDGWTERGKHVFKEIEAEINPPAPLPAPPEYHRLTAVD